MFNAAIVNMAEKVLANGDLSIDEALALIPGNTEAIMDLLTCADKIRRRFKQGRVFKCGIVNAKSGLCSEDCAFCAQSMHHHSGVEVYGMRSADQLIQTGLALAAAGATHYGVVTSGKTSNTAEVDTVCRVARVLRERTDLALCTSLGMLTEAAGRRLKAAGITRYHHNLETARSYFDRICTTHDYDLDIATLKAARSAGLKVCCGGILGMGETWAQRVELAFTLKALDVDVIPINFLNPIAGTRLADRALLPSMEALACIALVRFIHPHKDITICGGREVTLGDLQSWLFFAGANGLMVGNYLTTHGRDIKMDLEMIARLGLYERA